MADNQNHFSMEEQLRGLVEQLSAYIETYHGGEVEYVSLDGQTVFVRLGGACMDCPHSPSTVKGWIEGTIKQFFPEIEGVKLVE